MKRLFALFFISFCVVNVARAATDVEFILDVSGSMNKVHMQAKQIDTARASILKSLAKIPEGTFVALRAYGHRVEQTDKEGSCQDTELLVPMAKMDKSLIKQKIEGLAPKGYTPIAYSLKQSKGDFKKEREAKRVIILLSDGEETCGGDPVQVLKDLKSQGFELMVHTIGFNVDANTRKQLEAISKMSGGLYFDAKDAGQLDKALEEATQKSFLLEKEKKTYGEAVRGGDNYENAVKLPFGKELKLDHHQKRNDMDYFYLDLQIGDELTVVLNTLEKGVYIRDGKAIENGNPYAGLEFHDSKRKKIQSLNLIGARNGHQEKSLYVSQAGRYYVLLGSTYSAMNKDHVTFQIKLTRKGDLGSEKDAGDTRSNAMLIQPGKYEKNHIGSGDKKDLFKFSYSKGDEYYIGVIPSDEFKGVLSVRVFDEFKQTVLKKSASERGAGLKTKAFSLDESGDYYLELTVLYGDTRKTPSQYTLVLKKMASAKKDANKTDSKKEKDQ